MNLIEQIKEVLLSNDNVTLSEIMEAKNHLNESSIIIGLNRLIALKEIEIGFKMWHKKPISTFKLKNSEANTQR